MDMDWFNRDQPDPADEDKIVELKDVDLIARLLGDVVYIIEGTMYHKLAFVDFDRNLYFAEYKGHFYDVEQNDVVKLRSICM